MMIIIVLTLNFEWPRMNVLFISKISMFSWNLKVWKRSISPVNWSVSSLQSKLYPKALPKNNLYQKSSVKVDLGTIFHCAPQLWNFCLTDIKDTPSLSIFKEKLKPWHCNKCPCRLCKTHYYFMFCVTYILQNLVYNIYLLNDILLL